LPRYGLAFIPALESAGISARVLKRPKIGLALGSGGSRGLAHIGVIKVLEENNISKSKDGLKKYLEFFKG